MIGKPGAALSVGRMDLFHPEDLSGKLGPALFEKLGKTSPLTSSLPCCLVAKLCLTPCDPID